MSNLTDIVNFSFGVCSGYIACRLKDEGKEPINVFQDTKREDIDTYRFGFEIVRRWGLNLVNASDGRDLWDVFAGWKMIPARQVSACSRVMKIVPGQAFLEAFDGIGRVAFGYEPHEEDRAESVIKNWKLPHVMPWFPLIEWGVTKEQCFGYFLRHNVAPPRIYRHFQHANCLPCKNFQRKDWIALAYHYPDIFNDAMNFEESHGLRWIQEGTMLRDLLPEVPPHPPSRRGRRKLAMIEPAFDFTMGCDRCAMD